MGSGPNMSVQRVFHVPLGSRLGVLALSVGHLSQLGKADNSVDGPQS